MNALDGKQQGTKHRCLCPLTTLPLWPWWAPSWGRWLPVPGMPREVRSSGPVRGPLPVLFPIRQGKNRPNRWRYAYCQNDAACAAQMEQKGLDLRRAMSACLDGRDYNVR